MSQVSKKRSSKAVLALLIPAHNEATVIYDTIDSAIEAGMNPRHIYVVNDNSTDATTTVARRLLPKQNVVRVTRSGKGLAIKKAAVKFDLSNRYRWIHISDADGRFAPDYFRVLRRDLRVKYAAATGYVRNLPGSTVSSYRVFEYTIGMELHRRIQSLLGVIPVIPGPTSCFRGDVFAKVDFSSNTLVEDFDVTLQIYRQKLGKIQYIPKAVTFTQDPPNMKLFIRQITRWNRGVLQVMSKHKVPTRFSPVDLYLNYQIFQNLLFLVNFFVWVPYLTAYTGIDALAVAFLYDLLIMFALTSFSATKTGRWDAMAAFPLVYMYRWLNLLIFFKAYIEVMVLRKFRTAKGVWSNDAKRRYKLAKAS